MIYKAKISTPGQKIFQKLPKIMRTYKNSDRISKKKLLIRDLNLKKESDALIEGNNTW